MNTEPEQNQPAIAGNPMPNPEFRIGGVLSKTFGVFFKNFLPFVLMAALILIPLYVVQYFLYLGQFEAGDAGTGAAVAELIMVAAQMLAGYLVTASLVYGSIQELRGTRSNIVECFRRGLPLVLPVVGVSIVAGLIMTVGLLLLVVPGIIAAIMLAVVVPVAVVERPGIFASIGRSRELTKGHRWQLLGLFLVIVVISSIVGFVVAAIFGVSMVAAVDPESVVFGTVLANAVIGPITTAFYAVMISVIYHDLRISKEGDDTEEIAKVFD